MAAPDTIPGDLVVGGTFSCARISLPAGSIANVQIAAGATGNYVFAEKLEHQAPGAMGGSIQLFDPATAVAAVTRTLGMAWGVGTIEGISAWIEVAATGADRTITVDLQKSTAGGAYATVLSATIGFTNASAIRTAVNGTISGVNYVAGDILRLVVTVAGVAGAQATGLTVRVRVHEEPQ